MKCKKLCLYIYLSQNNLSFSKRWVIQESLWQQNLSKVVCLLVNTGVQCSTRSFATSRWVRGQAPRAPRGGRCGRYRRGAAPTRPIPPNAAFVLNLGDCIQQTSRGSGNYLQPRLDRFSLLRSRFFASSWKRFSEKLHSVKEIFWVSENLLFDHSLANVLCIP